MAELPRHVADVTPQWLTEALRTGGAIDATTRVVDVRCDAGAAGVGFMGEVARLVPMYDGGSGPASIIAKVPTQDENVRAMLAASRVFEREARFYLELAPEMAMVPDAYHVGADFERDDYVLLIEDLAHLRLGDQVTGASRDDAAAALEAAGRLHAAFWRAPRLDELTWMPRFNDPGHKIAREIYASSLPGFLNVFGTHVEPSLDAVVHRFGANTHQLLDRVAAMPTTLVHFDYRLDNLFFDDSRPGADGVRMIDFQATCKGGGVYDVGYFLSQNVSIDVRRANELDLLHAYHDVLVSGGVDDYAFEQLRADYRVGVLYGWIIPVFAMGSLDVSSARAMALWTEVVARAQAALVDHEVADLLVD